MPTPKYRSKIHSPLDANPTKYRTDGLSPLDANPIKYRSREHSPLPMLESKHLWVSGWDTQIRKINLDTYAVMGTYTLTGLTQGYVGDIDNIRHKLIVRANSSTVFVVNTNDPATYYSRTFTGYYSNYMYSILVDTSTGYCWCVGANSAYNGAFVTVFNYIDNTIVTSFAILNAVVPYVFTLGQYYSGSVDSTYVYFTCGNSASAPWPLVRINKNTYAYSYITFGNAALNMRHGIYKNHLYVTAMPSSGSYWQLHKVNLSSFTLSATLTTSGANYYPRGMGMDVEHGRLFVGSPAAIGPYFIHKFDLSSFTEVSKTSSYRTIAHALVYDPIRNLLYNGVDASNLHVYNPDDMTRTIHNVATIVYAIYLTEG